MTKSDKIITFIAFTAFLVFLIGFAGFISVARGSNGDYQPCVNRCYLDLPKVEECISDEKQYWDTSNITDLQIKKDCQHMIKSKKVDCHINCVVKEIRFEDEATKFYDTDVKNFPLTDQ